MHRLQPGQYTVALTVAAFTGTSTLLASQSASATFAVTALPPQIVLAPSGSQFLVPNERSFTLDGARNAAWQRRGRRCVRLTHALLGWVACPGGGGQPRRRSTLTPAASPRTARASGRASSPTRPARRSRAPTWPACWRYR